MKVQIRKAVMNDIDSLIEFSVEEAKEAEGLTTVSDTLRAGITAALHDSSKATYWVIVDENDRPFGNVSALKEWSDWNDGYYWWIQSMFISPRYRGKGYLKLLISAVKSEMNRENGLELRLYVHKDNKVAIRAYEKVGFVISNYDVMILKNH
jgi:RimJ/RimL family protein N-acetyltransferase